MPSDNLSCLIVAILILSVSILIYLVDRRVRKEGETFAGKITLRKRVYAMLVGILFGIFFWLEWLASLRWYPLLVLSLALIGYGIGQRRWLDLYQKRQRIVGIEHLQKGELELYLQGGAKFVIFDYCISVLVITATGHSDIYLIRQNEEAWRQGLFYSIVSLFFGWLALPFGPVTTTRCLINNFRGGHDVTTQVVAKYQRLEKLEAPNTLQPIVTI